MPRTLKSFGTKYIKIYDNEGPPTPRCLKVTFINYLKCHTIALITHPRLLLSHIVVEHGNSLFLALSVSLLCDK